MHEYHYLVLDSMRKHVEHADILLPALPALPALQAINAAVQHQLATPGLDYDIPKLLQREVVTVTKQIELGTEQLRQVHVLLTKAALFDVTQLTERNVNHLSGIQRHVFLDQIADVPGHQSQSVAGEVGIGIHD